MREFDPSSERHYPLFSVVAVEPGCTTEWQFVNHQTGEVTRITTTDNPAIDEQAFHHAALEVAKQSWKSYCENSHTVGTTAIEE